MKDIDIIDEFKKVLTIEQEAIAAQVSRIGEDTILMVKLLLECKGRVIVTGIGKAGLVGRKVSATLASTGTPSIFLHPSEAIHGDLGIMNRDDVVLTFSNSGSTGEVNQLLPYFKQAGIKIISLTAHRDSELARNSDLAIDVRVEREADPLNLVPTASSTVMLAMGDALAVVLMVIRGFEAKDFALFHPGGTLGRKLLLKVEDIMQSGEENPVVYPECTVREAIYEMTSKGLGATSVVNDKGVLVGIITDGDLRRLLEQNANPLNLKVEDVMTSIPKKTQKDILGIEAVHIMEQHAITVLPVVNERGRPIAMVHLHALIKAGLA